MVGKAQQLNSYLNWKRFCEQMKLCVIARGATLKASLLNWNNQLCIRCLSCPWWNFHSCKILASFIRKSMIHKEWSLKTYTLKLNAISNDQSDKLLRYLWQKRYLIRVMLRQITIFRQHHRLHPSTLFSFPRLNEGLKWFSQRQIQ